MSNKIIKTKNTVMLHKKIHEYIHMKTYKMYQEKILSEFEINLNLRRKENKVKNLKIMTLI